MPKEDAHITAVSEIGTVEEEMDEDACNTKDAIVVCVMNFESFRSCFICKGKVEVTSALSGKFEKCKMSLQFDRCMKQMVAKVVVELEGVTKILQEMCHVTEETLVTADRFNVKRRLSLVLVMVKNILEFHI